MRHSFASQFLAAGEPITYVSAQLGHRDSAITLCLCARWLPDTTTRNGVEDPTIARTFHPRLDPTRTPREMAIAWAIEERQAIEQA